MSCPIWALFMHVLCILRTMFFPLSLSWVFRNLLFKLNKIPFLFYCLRRCAQLRIWQNKQLKFSLVFKSRNIPPSHVLPIFVWLCNFTKIIWFINSKSNRNSMNINCSLSIKLNATLMQCLLIFLLYQGFFMMYCSVYWSAHIILGRKNIRWITYILYSKRLSL